MAIDTDQLNRLNADYATLTGKPVQRFVCPITLQDDPDVELCDGHILNDKIKRASRATAVQRKDVDNYFGTTIEPDLVKLLNMPVATAQELLRHARSLAVTGPSGEKMDAFFANRKARARFQQVDLLNPDGTALASPFLRTGRLEPRMHRDLQVEWLTAVTNSAVVGGLVKSAYLALFRMLGYRWTFDAAGDKVRRALVGFYRDRADKDRSAHYFSEFNGAVGVLLNDVPEDLCDTLKDGSLWFHYAEGDHQTGLLFALTCLFQVNGRMITVTVPGYQKEGYYFVAYRHYQTLLKDRGMPQNVYYARFGNDQFELSTVPLRMYCAPQPRVGTRGLAE